MTLAPRISFADAANYTINFGKFNNRSIIQAAREHKGLDYLRWLEQVRRIDGKNDPIDFNLRRFLKEVTDYDHTLPLNTEGYLDVETP